MTTEQMTSEGLVPEPHRIIHRLAELTAEERALRRLLPIAVELQRSRAEREERLAAAIGTAPASSVRAG